MVRAGVFVGVDKTGDLPTLNDAAAGAKRMYEWALGQGIADQTHAKLITDAGGRKVEAEEIADAIEAICSGAGVDQLLVYFAGHGINVQRGDRWLLSDAPARTYAAVNVRGSVELAMMCGIGHVVMISDACRVAAEGIQNQNVQGVEVFPNAPGGDKTRPVDQFFACYLGRTAAEVKDTAQESANYSALYTDALLDALLGTRADVLEPGDAGDAAKYIRPWALHDYLVAEIPRRVKALKLERKVNQNPDSIITSRNTWLARIDAAVAARRGGAITAARPPGPAPRTLRTLARDLIASVSGGRDDIVARTIDDAVAADVPGAAQFAGSIQQVAASFGPAHFESQCGIKVRGARIVDFVAPRATGSLLGAGDLLRVDSVEGPGVSILVRFDNTTACIVPVFPGYLAALTCDAGEVVDIAYEPSDNTLRWDDYGPRAPELRTLRAVVAAASRHGRFHVTAAQAESLGKRLEYAGGLDPTLALYAAYAYHDAQLVDRIRDIATSLHDSLGITFFDLELLGRRLMRQSVDSSRPVVPFVPLLSQGWSLLTAHRINLHPALDGIERSLRDSLWTQFESSAVPQLERAMRSKEVR